MGRTQRASVRSSHGTDTMIAPEHRQYHLNLSAPMCSASLALLVGCVLEISLRVDAFLSGLLTGFPRKLPASWWIALAE